MGSSMGSFRAQGSSLAPPSWSSQPSPFSQQLSKDSWEIGWARSGGGAHHFCPHFIGQTLTVWGPETERFLKPARAFVSGLSPLSLLNTHPAVAWAVSSLSETLAAVSRPEPAHSVTLTCPGCFLEMQARLLHYCRCKFTTYFPAL